MSNRVLKLGPARRVDPGLGPVQVEAKTRLEIGPKKPGRPGTRSTQSNPGETRSIFFILTVIKRRCFGILKYQNAENWRVKKNEAISVTIFVAWLLIAVVSLWKRFESPSFTLCFLWPLALYPSPDVEPLRPLVQRGSTEMIRIKRKQRHSLAPEMLRIERLGNEGSLAAHLVWDKCKLLRVFFSSSRPRSTKRGISIIDPMINH